MSSIPGWQTNITGASGTQGLLGPKSGYRMYVLPRGGHASQASVGTTITFDSSDVASRFAVNQWIQVGLSTANIRQVSGVGGNSIAVNSAVTVALNDRVYAIGSTQPTVTGGSATYTVPSSVIRQRDDDQATRFTNSMVTSNSDGLAQFWSDPNTYDAIIQDGNQSNVGSIIDLEVGSSQSTVSVFGATVTINAALGVTGWATFGSTVTMNANAGISGSLTVGGGVTVSGWARFGQTVTMNANAGITGSLTVGQGMTVSGAVALGATLSVTGNQSIGGSLSVVGGLSVSGTVTLSDGAIGTSEIVSGAVTGTSYKQGTSSTIVSGPGGGTTSIVGASISYTPYGVSSVMLITAQAHALELAAGASWALMITRGTSVIGYGLGVKRAVASSESVATAMCQDTGVSGATTYELWAEWTASGANQAWQFLSSGNVRPKLSILEIKR